MDTIGISYGRFNPPHKGHVAVWEQAATCDYFYLGTNPSTTGNKNPLPYDIKVELIELLCPITHHHVLPEKNLFTLTTTIYDMHGSNNELRVYTDEEWLFNSLIKYNGVLSTHGYYYFNKIINIKTERVCSSTSLRKAVANQDKMLFYQLAGIPIDTEIRINNKVYKFFNLIEEFIGIDN